jgi:hypothetical protein
MAKKDVGKGTILRFCRTEDTGGRGRDTDNRNRVSKQDDPKDEKFKGGPSIHVSAPS